MLFDSHLPCRSFSQVCWSSHLPCSGSGFASISLAQYSDSEILTQDSGLWLLNSFFCPASGVSQSATFPVFSSSVVLSGPKMCVERTCPHWPAPPGSGLRTPAHLFAACWPACSALHRAPGCVAHSQRLHWVPTMAGWTSPGGSSGKEPTCQCRRRGFHSWVGKIPWRRKWQPTPVFLPGKSHGQRSLVGYSPWGHKRVGHNWATEQEQQAEPWRRWCIWVVVVTNEKSYLAPVLETLNVYIW